MEYFVKKESIVRDIWGKSDTILLIFAGAAAEFALSKAVDWLYFTGKIPKDPLGRLFSTVTYARDIVFSEKDKAYQSIQAINHIHAHVENKRQSTIPEWAYKHVLYMLIDYSIRSYSLMERELTMTEKQEVLKVFCEVGSKMGINNLPNTFERFEIERHQQLQTDLKYSEYSEDLYKQYRKHLGFVRYKLLLETQKILLPDAVRQLLNFKKVSIMGMLVSFYKFLRMINLNDLLKSLILPSEYKREIRMLDNFST